MLLGKQPAKSSEMHLVLPILKHPPDTGSFPRNLSASGLSDSMRAPGITTLTSVRERGEWGSSSDSDADSSVVEDNETDSPSCDDLHPSLIMDSEDSDRYTPSTLLLSMPSVARSSRTGCLD